MRRASFGQPFAGSGTEVCIKCGTDELRRCQEVATVGALELVERVGGEDDDFEVHVGPGDLRVDAIGGSLLARVLADELGDVELARCTGRTSSKKRPCPTQTRPAAGTPWRARPDTRAASTERMGCVEG